MIERLPFHFSFSRTGEGNGSPLQCSCLENPRDRGAWWAAVYGVTQSRTRLKRLSSSSRAARPHFDGDEMVTGDDLKDVFTLRLHVYFHTHWGGNMARTWDIIDITAQEKN